MFVAVHRQTIAGSRVAHHHRPQKHHQIGLFAAARLAFEQIAKKRYIGQARHPVVAAGEFVLQQAAQHHHRAVFHQHIRFNRALVGGGAIGGVDGRRQHAGHLLEDGQFDGAVFADLRLDLEREAHVLALNGLEGVDRAVARVGVGELAGDKGHVLADHNFGLFVVQGEQIGRGQYVARAAGFQEARQKAQHIHAVGLLGRANVQARRWGHGARSGAGGQADDVFAAHAKVGAQEPDHAVARVACRTLPLHAKLGCAVGADFGNQALHIDLRAARVQALNHGAQLAVLRVGRGDDERIGGRVRLHLAARGGRKRGRRAAWRASSGTGAGVHRCATERGAQGGGQLGGVGVFQVHHVQIAQFAIAFARRLVQLFH